MLLRLLLLFTVVPLVELSLLFWIAERTDWGFTLALVIVTGFVGAALARREGLRCWLAAQEKINRGELPTDSLLDGLMILLAGAVLITPGVLTDLFGFALLVPPIRGFLRRWLARRIRARIVVAHPQGDHAGPSRDEVIDARVIDVESRDTDDDA